MGAKTNPVNWFEVPVTDLERARKFYNGVFGYMLEVHDMGFVKMSIGEYGFIAHFEDSEGNRVGLHSMS